LEALHSRQGLDRWTIVTGNEACDLDSVASAIGYAYLANRLAANSGQRFAAIVQTLRNDLALRPENIASFEDSNIDVNNLITLEDLPQPRSVLSSLTFAIVDHNVLSPEFGPNAKVVSVLDHHDE